MKMKLFIAALPVLCIPCLDHAGDPPGECMKKAMTSEAMNECAGSDFKNADRRMNVIYRQLMNGKHDPKFKAALRKSQRAWLAYRDSVIGVYYPDPNGLYGTVRPMCESEILEELTLQRVKELESLLHPTDGNVCRAND